MAKRLDLRRMILCALFAALIGVGAFIKIPIALVPITMQTMFVLMAGAFLGAKWGAVSAALYMIIGLIGVPVFTNGGGIGYVFQPSFGYIIGFVAGAFITGFIIEKSNRFNLETVMLASSAGLLAIYIFGCVYLYFIVNVYMGKELGVSAVIYNYFLIFLPGDISTALIGGILAVRIKPILLKIKA